MMKKMPAVPSHDHAEDFFNDDDIFQILADTQIGDIPATTGTGGMWGTAYDSPDNTVLCQAVYKGKIYAGTRTSGKIYVSADSGVTWALSFDTGSISVNSLLVFQDRLFAGITNGPLTNPAVPAIYVFDEIAWTVACAISSTGHSITCYGLGALNGGIFAGLSKSSYWVSNSPSGDLGSWTATSGITTAADSFTLHHNELYAGCNGSSSRPVYKWTGATWSIADSDISGNDCLAVYSWNGKIYATGEGGKVRSSATGSYGSWATVFESGMTNRAFIEYNGKLLVACADKLYRTNDGITWTLFYDSAATTINSLLLHEDKLFVGTGVGGKILVYIDTTLVSAPGHKVMGNLEFWGQFRPGGAPGTLYNLLMSGGPGYSLWLANGTAIQYLKGGSPPVFSDLLADVTARIVCCGGEIVTCGGEVVYVT
jgi:hypothetical protein